MARVNQGFLGNASGKLGNVVFAKWRQLNTARQYQPDIQDANSPAQKQQRSRMMALLQFLKPINKSFIRLFNSPLAKCSTPWAVAIKSNMPRVSPEGNFLLENLQLGDPCIPPAIPEKVIYNPFIDQASFSYSPVVHPAIQNPFPYIASSVLGEYSSDSFAHEFDIRHVLCCLPEGRFFCSIYDNNYEYVFDNFWSAGLFWMIYFNTYDLDKVFNPNDGLSLPAYFQPVSIIEGFNTVIKENPVPLDAITWSYIENAGNWSLVFKMDFSKTTLQKPKDFTVLLWFVALVNGSNVQSDVHEWNLTSNTYTINLGAEGMKGSIIPLYATYTKHGVQVGKFNRFYIEKGSEGTVFPFFDQLFDCNYSHPASFVLSGNQCGFCGNINVLFSDFIELWEQGVIHEGISPYPAVEYSLTLEPCSNGSVTIENFNRQEGNEFFFTKSVKARLSPIPDHGYKFNLWSGPDATDIVKIDESTFELTMSKARSIGASFIAI